MTKKEMIKTMQEKEASRWETLQNYEDIFGNENEHTKQALHRWGTLYRLMEELGVETKRGEA